ncbi:tRNA (guanosine(37)-N1)-methyltransferase TrmD [Eubacterium xylanophilum]|uniref:tRNA (guanosine(37)-N1)-methyltransferase TrmD n=1 Tax=Eubacterium xylanophilum TaxID=39497 RepID=UPI00047BE0D1|nr:tRNA (guanosine(37)-N1)-methyltransferase TrmD [Eubacterium xylanophilum]
MNYYIMTLFPEMFDTIMGGSIIGRASEKGLLGWEAINIRDYTLEKHGKVDDYPYGGGAGMVMQVEPIHRCFEAIKEKSTAKKRRVIYMTPWGHTFDQKMARDFAAEEELVFLCGHYEGVDERILEEIVTDYVSVGDYVLTGGELPAMTVIDAVSRLIPGVLGNGDSAVNESFSDGLLEHPQYSRPETILGKSVPPILLSGDHKKVDEWRHEKSLERTKMFRPDLYEKYFTEKKE